MTYKNFTIKNDWPVWTAKNDTMFLYAFSQSSLINLINKKAK